MKNNKFTKHYTVGEKNVIMEGYEKLNKFIPDGEVAMFTKTNKKILHGFYVNGKPNSKWTRWYDDGKIASEHYYVLGKMKGDNKQYWNNGNMAWERKQGKENRYEIRTFSRDGEKENHITYLNEYIVNARIKTIKGYLEYDLHGKVFHMPGMIPRKICYINQNNSLRCKTPEQIWHDLNTFLSPEDVANILTKFNDAYDELNLDKSKKILTVCGGSYVSTGVDTSSQTPIAIPAGEHDSGVTQPEFDDIFSVCTDKAARANIQEGIDSLDPTSGSFSDAVNQIEESVNNCHEQNNSMIAAGSGVSRGASFSNVGLGVFINMLSEKIMVIYDYVMSGDLGYDIQPYFTSGFGAPIEESKGVYVQYAEDNTNLKLVTDTNNNTTSLIYDRRENGVRKKTQIITSGIPATLTLIEEIEEDGITKKTEIIKHPDGTTTRNYYENGILIDSTTIDKYGNEISPANSNLPNTTSSTGSIKRPIEGDQMTKCEQIAAWWASKKAYCDEQNWQSYDCQEILRVFVGGCADPALVNPGPEGTIYCAQNKGMTDEEIRQAECEKKKMIWAPSGFDRDMCFNPSNVKPIDVRIDPCSNPQTMCSPETLIPSESLDAIAPYFNPYMATSKPAVQRSSSNNLFMHSNLSYDSIGELNESNFEEHLSTSKGLHVVVFGSINCAPCHKVLSVFNDMVNASKDVSYSKVEIWQNPSLRQKYDIKYTPTIIVFQDSKIIGQRRVGAASREVLQNYIKRSIDLAKKTRDKLTHIH